MKRLLRSEKQRIIVGRILRLAGEGTFLSVKDLHASMPYTCKYGSFRRSIDFLVAHQVVVKERAGLVALVKPTTKAYALFVPET